MDKDKLKYFKDKLIKEKKDIIKSLKTRDNEEYGSIDMYYTELSAYDNHPGDIGTEVFQMEQDKGFRNKLGDTLEKIESSLENIEKGSYGICSLCNNPINEERLELIPYLTTCIDCSEKNIMPIDYRQFDSIDSKRLVSFSIRPKTNTAYDREDGYQDAAVFNMVPGDPSYTTGDNMGVMDEEENDGTEEIEKISQEYYEDTLK
ncbi:TraR/DksA C4-type zinc finger protein [Wansuia hejianensis]|uniref:TraR/DksA C4-type zinc finger protein n=1 Tax=Wansuia hejianensis TaxID=2763667 RepID=A0A926IN88_9FIRM|nr:TraR/DksA C4-type zinc finger protein [Wansuia hejianensis]MBC8590443.1 TraR/DksA C4-type zinc finger protein [Wansuia hejianensis]